MAKKFALSLSMDVKRTDPNQLGEFLRSVAFVGPGYGYYGGYDADAGEFDIRPDARKWSVEERAQFLKDVVLGEADPWLTETSAGYTFQQDNLLIDVFWYCDGDGDLTFRIRTQEGEVLRVINNDDCKKEHRWIVVKKPGDKCCMM